MTLATPSPDHAERLAQWLLLLLEHVDYTRANCQPTQMIGAVLPAWVIDEAREVLLDYSGKELPERWQR
jgi:hypothetical protein